MICYLLYQRKSFNQTRQAIFIVYLPLTVDTPVIANVNALFEFRLKFNYGMTDDVTLKSRPQDDEPFSTCDCRNLKLRISTALLSSSTNDENCSTCFDRTYTTTLAFVPSPCARPINPSWIRPSHYGRASRISLAVMPLLNCKL